MKHLITLLVFIALTGCSNPSIFERLGEGVWLDLSHDFSKETIYWPTSDKFQFEPVFVGHRHGFYYEAYKFCTAEHGGTHADAPIHFAENKKSIDEVSIDQLIGEAVVVDVSDKSSLDRDYQVSVDDLKAWEKKNGKIPESSILLLNTGYSKYWGDPERYLGTSKRGEAALAELHFPALSAEAAEWLVEKRKIKAFGLDTASIDYGQSKDYMVHQTLFKNDIVAFENLTNLDKLPAKGALVIALPMKIKDGSGGPTRIVAWLEN